VKDEGKERRLAECIRLADAAYEEMYESRGSSGPYSDMKDFMIEAIALAEQLGLKEKVEELKKTLEHRKTVFRDQMR
jgi:hypothetical protein